ncbi:MAG TPA: hypothetical protein VIG99_26930 [Myxococcaceae bacterium]
MSHPPQRTPLPAVRACLLAALGALAAVSSWSCNRDSADRAAKKRIFSPEDPPRVVASAKEKLAAGTLGSDPALARRVLRMDAAETTERIGAHRYQATVKFEWGTRGGQLDLTENRTLQAGPGGVSGDFHAVVTNGHDQGLDIIRVHGDVFARGKYGKYRQRLRDRGMAERGREEVFGALRDFDTLFLGRLKLEPYGEVSSEGRNAQRYRVTLGPAVQPVSGGAALPPLLEPKGGTDAATLNRRRFADKREPQEISGELWVDEETSVVLHAKLEGRIKVPAEGEQGKEAFVRLTLDGGLGDIGQDPGLRAPEEFLPDEDKPPGIADALDRFGVARAGVTDAGASSAAATSKPPEEPEDESP